MSRLRMLSDNPLIVRAFRVGFRPGRGNFHLTFWTIALLALVGIHVAGEMVFHTIDDVPGFAGRALLLLILFTVGTFTISGLQRMLVAFSLELEQGSFDFLHLSTMKPSTMVFGFLFAGQLPGYWILLVTFPLMLIAGIAAGVNLLYLVALVAAIAGFVVFFSLLFMLAGFWMRQVVDLRGVTVILTVAGLLLVTGVSLVMGGAQWNLARYLGILGVIPVGVSLWKRGFAAPGEPGQTLPFFGTDMALELHALLLYVPLGFVIFFSLVGSLRYRERRPLSNVWGFFLVVWVQLLLTGLTWGLAATASNKLTWLALVTFPLVTLLIHHRCLRSVSATERVIDDTVGRFGRMLVHPQAPPFLLVGALALAYLGFCLLQTLGSGTPMHPLGWLGVPLVLVLHFLLVQYLEWRERSWPLWSWLFQGLLVYAPLVVYAVLLFLEKRGSGMFPSLGSMAEAGRALVMVSPLAQAIAPSMETSLADLGAERAGTVIFLLIYLLATGVLGYLCLRRWRGLVADTLKPDRSETPPAPAETAGT